MVFYCKILIINNKKEINNKKQSKEIDSPFK